MADKYGPNDDHEVHISTRTKERRGRKKKNGKKIIEWGFNKQAVGKWAEEFKTFTGKLVRAHVNINIKTWKEVPTSLKEHMWREIRRDYFIEDRMKKVIYSKLAKLHRDWRNKMRTGYVYKTRPVGQKNGEAYDKYKDQITKEQWEEFMARSMTSEFKTLSEKNKQAALMNEYNHHMGRSGYALSIPKWKEQGLLDHFMPASEVVSTNSSEQNADKYPRHVYWFCGRANLTQDGQLNFPGNSEGMWAKKEKLKNVQEVMAAGTWAPNGRHDILSEVIGQPDHPGRARGVGGVVGYTHLFERELRSACPEKKNNLNDEQLKLLQEKWRKDMDEFFTARGFQARFTSTSVHSESVGSPSPSIPHKSFKDGTSCQVCVESSTYAEDETLDTVARALAYNPGPEGTLCDAPISGSTVRVKISMVCDGFDQCLLPIPNGNAQITVLADAIGTFVQWPAHLVVFGGEEPLPLKTVKRDNKKKPEKPFVPRQPPREMYSITTYPLVNDDTLKTLKGDMLEMHETLKYFKPEFCKFSLPQSSELFHYNSVDDMFGSVIERKDIKEFLECDSINMSIILAFLVCLNAKLEEVDVDGIAFLCPSLCSYASFERDMEGVTSYLVQNMNDLFHKRLIVLPYNQRDHWLLVVICPSVNKCYILDSLPGECDMSCLKKKLSLAYKVASVHYGNGKSTEWQYLKCARQIGRASCGYYLMRFMWEVCFSLQGSDDIGKDWISREEPYSIVEIDEMRNMWCRHFLDIIMEL
ncbi:unnamed protein product [Cuscuta epithymum]|uniref:Ubiquitin-like protease family profile domain-containing protein n=1 Tax=Cuscuta epithymum TaxID=186058 RepID=A0AAV0DZD8_9ASTE|nr:unnamed protein product [Cuscuta epithymum]